MLGGTGLRNTLPYTPCNPITARQPEGVPGGMGSEPSLGLRTTHTPEGVRHLAYHRR